MKKIFVFWYFDLYVSQYFYNNKIVFKNLWLIYISFIIVVDQVIKARNVRIIFISFKNKVIKLQNMALANKYNSNLLSLG